MFAITRYGFIRSVQFGGTDLPCVVPDRTDVAGAKADLSRRSRGAATADSHPAGVPSAATRPMQTGRNRRSMGSLRGVSIRGTFPTVQLNMKRKRRTR